MKPLEQKKALKEKFKKNKKTREENNQKVLRFNEFKIDVDIRILNNYRNERGRCY